MTKTVGILVEKDYQELEVWYPILRLKEAGHRVLVIGTGAETAVSELYDACARVAGFDDKFLALYARGMTVREIQGFLAEMYGVEVSPDVIRTVTDGIVAEVTAWQNRLLERMTQRGFVPSDPLYAATLRAQAGLQELHMAAHYASCKSGVGKPAR